MKRFPFQFLLVSVVFSAFSVAAAQALPAPQFSWTKPLKVVSPVTVGSNGDLTFLSSDAQIVHAGRTGQALWAFKLGDLGRAQPLLRPDGGVVAAAYDDVLYSLDAQGKLLWKTKLDGDIFATPALRPDGSVVVATAGGTVYALSAAGQTLWTFKVGAPVFSSPALATDGTLYFGAQDGRLRALTPDGKLKWEFAARLSVFSSPALDEAGNLYFGSADRQIYSLTPAGGLRWSKATGLFVNASPIVTSSGLVVVGSYDGYLYAVTTAGQDAWSYRAGAAITAPAAELSDQTLVVGDLSGTLHVVNAAGQPLWTLGGLGKVDTGVALSDTGTLYFTGEGGTLRAIERLRPLATGPWTTFRGTPLGWGRVPSAAEQLAQRQSRQAAASTPLTVQPRPATKPPVTAAAPLPKPPVPSQPVRPAPSLTQLTQVISAGARAWRGEVYLPLTPLAEAFALQVSGAGQGWASVSEKGQTTLLPTRTFDKRPFIALSRLGLLGVQAQWRNGQLELSQGQQRLLLPVRLGELLRWQARPELSRTLQETLQQH